jgi:hypothetical protein
MNGEVSPEYSQRLVWTRLRLHQMTSLHGFFDREVLTFARAPEPSLEPGETPMDM